eukprot:s3973_g6.t1
MGQSCAPCATTRVPEPGPPRPSQVPRGARFDGEPWVAFHSNAFQVASSVQTLRAPRAAESQRDGNVELGWRRAYSQGRLLGDGISAQALAIPPQPAEAAPPGACSAAIATAGMGHCLREHGRKVAIKVFHRLGGRTFLKELTALRRVGTHPNVLRLLESYQGFGSQDVLVLEYCDGSTLYDLYAREHPKGGLPERLVARLLRQLFLALAHLASCGVEHQDAPCQRSPFVFLESKAVWRVCI